MGGVPQSGWQVPGPGCWVQVFQTKRKAFDMAAARAPEVASDGTFGDVPALKRRSDTGASRAAGGRAALGRAPAAKPKGQAKWKAQSAQLRAAMAAGRGGAQAGGGAAAGFAPAPEPDMVGCLHEAKMLVMLFVWRGRLPSSCHVADCLARWMLPSERLG